MQRIGYIRVSSVDQNTARQEELLTTCDRVFEDKCSGSNTDRPQLQELIRYARNGDTVVVHSIDRLARDLSDLEKLIDTFKEKGVSVVFEKENLSFSADGKDAMSELMLQIFGAVAQFERAKIRERQAEGIAKAKEKGVYKGRKKQITPELVAETLKETKGNKAAAARQLGCTERTIYRNLPAEG